MRETQKDIYYITGNSFEDIESSPFLETLKKKDIECIFMRDPLDEYVMQRLREYDGKKFVSVTKEGLELDLDEDEAAELKKAKEDTKKLCTKMKEILGEKFEKVALKTFC